MLHHYQTPGHILHGPPAMGAAYCVGSPRLPLHRQHKHPLTTIWATQAVPHVPSSTRAPHHCCGGSASLPSCYHTSCMLLQYEQLCQHTTHASFCWSPLPFPAGTATQEASSPGPLLPCCSAPETLAAAAAGTVVGSANRTGARGCTLTPHKSGAACEPPVGWTRVKISANCFSYVQYSAYGDFRKTETSILSVCMCTDSCIL